MVVAAMSELPESVKVIIVIVAVVATLGLSFFLVEYGRMLWDIWRPKP